MKTTFKFRLYPNKEQSQRLEFTLDKCKFTYNQLLDFLNKSKKIDKNKNQHHILKLKKENEGLNEVYSKVLQYENYRLFSNLKALAQSKKRGRIVGKLRFKGKGWFKTFSYNQSGFNISDEGKRYTILHLSKIGNIRMRIGNKQNRPKGEIKQITIKKTKTNKWFAFVISDEKFKKLKKTHKKVGIDLGLENYVYDSDGNHFDSPKYLRESEDRLKWLHRELSRKKKGSNNRQKAKLRLNIKEEHLKNQRIDSCHKLSNYYVKNYDFIAVEDLQIPNMVQNHHLSKSILDSSWSCFTQFMSYKVERTDKKLVWVNPNNTSQICSSCGRLVKKTLATRKHKCICGLNIHRDYNSAILILNRGIGKELPKYTLVETKPLLGNEQVMVRETRSHLR